MERVGADDDVAYSEPVTPILALAELYDASFAPMVRLAGLLVGSPEAAADIVQDAFVYVPAPVGGSSRPGRISVRPW